MDSRKVRSEILTAIAEIESRNGLKIKALSYTPGKPLELVEEVKQPEKPAAK